MPYLSMEDKYINVKANNVNYYMVNKQSILA